MRVLVTVALSSVWIVACSADAAEPDAAGASEGDEEEKCPADLPEFATGDEGGLRALVRGSSLAVRLIDADHQPPKKDYNTWTVSVVDAASGEAASDAVSLGVVLLWRCTGMDRIQRLWRRWAMVSSSWSIRICR